MDQHVEKPSDRPSEQRSFQDLFPRIVDSVEQLKQMGGPANRNMPIVLGPDRVLHLTGTGSERHIVFREGEQETSFRVDIAGGKLRKLVVRLNSGETHSWGIRKALDEDTAHQLDVVARQLDHELGTKVNANVDATMDTIQNLDLNKDH